MSKKVIVYDDEIYNVSVYDVTQSADTKDYHIVAINKKDENNKFIIPYAFDIVLSEHQKVELDPTTMLRIAKYNDNAELQDICKKIEDNKKLLNRLENKVCKTTNKINNFNEFIDNNLSGFLNNNNKEDDFMEYIKDCYNLSDDYYDSF